MSRRPRLSFFEGSDMLIGTTIRVGRATVERVVAREFAVMTADQFDVVVLLADGQLDGTGWATEIVRIALAASKKAPRPARQPAAAR